MKTALSNDEIRTRLSQLGIEPDVQRRVLMTAGCRDCDSIPKVPGAGEVFANGNLKYQLMHNGVKVVEDCYCGRWMTELIRLLKGHHEPQEEKLFHEILKHVPQGATMLELGSYWGYYSLWFQQAITAAQTYLIEPDPSNLAVGRRNFEINSATGRFFQFSVGREPLAARPFICEDGVERSIAETSVDHFIGSEGLSSVDLLLADIQGAELEMLEGARCSIEARKIRFLFLSTHHHSISHDPLTHQRCLAWLEKQGAHVLAAHNVTESYSGDGLIVASFDDRDRQLQEIEISKNYPTNSLFPELEYDLAEAQERLQRELNEKKQQPNTPGRSMHLPGRSTLIARLARRLAAFGSASKGTGVE